jgi:hypothetical protein
MMLESLFENSFSKTLRICIRLSFPEELKIKGYDLHVSQIPKSLMATAT